MQLLVHDNSLSLNSMQRIAAAFTEAGVGYGGNGGMRGNGVEVGGAFNIYTRFHPTKKQPEPFGPCIIYIYIHIYIYIYVYNIHIYMYIYVCVYTSLYIHYIYILIHIY